MTTPIPPVTPPRQFDYEAQTATGQSLRGSIDAPAADIAAAQLNALGLRVLSLNSAPQSRPAARPIAADDFLLFNQQLAHLTKAGLPVEQGLRLIAADVQSGRLANAANAVAAELEKGASLREAFARHAADFPHLYANLIDAGVQSGNLSGMLFGLGKHLELTSRLRRALWKTFSYPFAVLLALACILLFISLQILPRMKGVYDSFGNDYTPSGSSFTLPFLTRALFWFGPKIPFILLGLFAMFLAAFLAIAICRYLGKQGVILDRLVIPLPLVGPIVRQSLLSRWCHALRLGIDAGLDLPRAISLTSDALGSPRLSAEGQSLVDALARGEPLFDLHGKMIPPAVPAAIEFGARTGDLPSTLSTLSAMYEQQADERLRSVPSILTPFLMIFIAAVIGTTVLALFLPLFKLLQSLSSY